jgi:hypothetical protein
MRFSYRILFLSGGTIRAGVQKAAPVSGTSSTHRKQRHFSRFDLKPLQTAEIQTKYDIMETIISCFSARQGYGMNFTVMMRGASDAIHQKCFQKLFKRKSESR